MQQDVKASYSEFHQSRSSIKVYPSEFVIRTFLGTYPHLKLDNKNYTDRNILDLGFGDGRNLAFLEDIGFNVHGVEISKDIINLGVKKSGINAAKLNFKEGHNSQIPFANEYFDYILACHSCYYVNSGTTFSDNLKEIQRTLKKDGVFICSVPSKGNFILKNSHDLGNGHAEIKHDPYTIRNGYTFKYFSSESEIIEDFSPYFYDFSIGFLNDNYFGIELKAYIIVCRKK
jgi:SAM-dependent methyltransferase